MTTFFAKLSEMSERFDPRYVAFKRRSADFHYPAVRLSELLSEPPEYGAGEAGIDGTDIAKPRYIRITDIDEDGELRSGLGATAETIESKYLLQDGDLLFARSGATVGKCYLHNAMRTPEPCIYAGYMIRFRFNEKVLPKYVFDEHTLNTKDKFHSFFINNIILIPRREETDIEKKVIKVHLLPGL